VTNQEHPITPPPELIAKWASSMCGYYEAARWGADQELEACVSYVDNMISGNKARALRAARRPKPPSLKAQALEALEVEDDVMPLRSLERSERFDTIRRALEALPE